VVCGILIGMLLSAIFILLGVSVWELGLEYLWVITLTLASVHIRFICLSYGGGVLAFLALSEIVTINIAGLIALVGVLHLAEGLLVLLDGGKSCYSVWVWQGNMRTEGYLLQNIWPIPFVMLGALWGYNGMTEWQMPLWWPLLGAEYSATYLILPLIALLGYSETTIKKCPVLKERRAAIRLFFYGSVLLGGAIFLQNHRNMELLLGMAMPLLHEQMLWCSKKEETADWEKLRILKDGQSAMKSMQGLYSNTQRREIRIDAKQYFTIWEWAWKWVKRRIAGFKKIE